MGNFCYSEGTYSSERELYIQECEQIDRNVSRQWRQQRLNHKIRSIQFVSNDEDENLHPEQSLRKEQMITNADDNYDNPHNAWSFKLF